MFLSIKCANLNHDCKQTASIEWPKVGEFVIIEAVQKTGWIIEARPELDGVMAWCSEECQRGELPA